MLKCQIPLQAIPLVVMVAIPSAFAVYTLGRFAAGKQRQEILVKLRIVRFVLILTRNNGSKPQITEHIFLQCTMKFSGRRQQSQRALPHGTRTSIRGPKPQLARALASHIRYIRWDDGPWY